MKRVLRTMAAAVLAIGGVVGVSSAAAADDPPAQGCEEEGDEYFGGGVCQVVLEAVAVCEDNVPYLDYEALLEGTSETSVTVTWHNPAGDGEVIAGQPLTGRLVWPGTVLDENGKAVDYPGWTKNADGTWSAGDAYSWASGSVDVTFSANPEATTTVTYPSAGGVCVPVSQTSSGGGELSASSGGGVLAAYLSDTGFSAAPLAGAAGGLVLAGGLLLLVSRMRRPHTDES